MIGFAIASKLIAVGSLIIFIILIFLLPAKTWKDKVKDSLLFAIISIIFVSPWFVFSSVNTGNPFYPFFTNIYPTHFDTMLLNPLHFVLDLWNLFLYSADPIHPLYLISLPLLVFVFSKFSKQEKIVFSYSALSLLIWYITPQTGGGRFILPYLPAWSLLLGIMLKKIDSTVLRNYILMLAVCIACISIIYRGVANKRYVPVILGKETKQTFLSQNLNFEFGDFYDTDGYLKKHVESTDRVLLIGFHNLYYVDFPFLDSSYAKKGDTFNYIAIQGVGKSPEGFRLVYKNPQTHVQLYSNGRWNTL